MPLTMLTKLLQLPCMRFISKGRNSRLFGIQSRRPKGSSSDGERMVTEEEEGGTM